jgi:shikimate 5-dehydrogenase
VSGGIVDNAKTMAMMGAGGAGTAVVSQNITVNNDGSASVQSSDASRFGAIMQQVALATIQREQRPGGSLNPRRG